MTPLPAEAIGALYSQACLAELAALKPGNVHRHGAGHGMTLADFETSARVSAPHLAAPGRPVGQRILGAVAATRDAVGQNTNLGIILLCAPLAAAAESSSSSLPVAIAGVLAALDDADAADTFRAIALANPGGLGQPAKGDVRTAPSMGLVEAMRLAAGRDRIARQYATGFADIVAMGLPLAHDRAMDEAAQPVFLAFTTAFPDSHVARKHGDVAAQALMQRFRAEVQALPDASEARHAALAAFDRALKAEGLNPGTSADLTVATLFAAALSKKFP